MQHPYMWLAIGYILGSIPFGLILTWMTGGGDIRTIGSGNIGATNVLRTGKKGVAAATLLLDGGKGFLAVWLASHFAGNPGAETGVGVAALAAGAGAFIGHVYPLWLKFKGGKGVATLLGVSLGFGWWIGLAFAVSWLGVALVSRISSLGGMAGGFGAAGAALALGQPRVAAVLAALALWVLYTHRENIARLRAGTEPKIGKSAKKPVDSGA